MQHDASADSLPSRLTVHLAGCLHPGRPWAKDPENLKPNHPATPPPSTSVKQSSESEDG